MKNIYYILPLLVATSLFSAEPSAFDAGNLDAGSPYGLTESEKHLVNTRNKVQDVSKEVGSVKIQMDTVNEQLEGLRSVFDALNKRISKFEKSISSLEAKDEQTNAAIEQVKVEMEDIKLYLQESKNIQEENQNNLKTALKEITTIVDKINNNYVTKANYSKLEKRVVALEALATEKKAAEPKFGSMTNVEIIKKGEELYAKKEYAAAKPYFEHTLQKRHRPARSSFILGEIEYFTNNYSNAIVYYKQSAGLSSDTNWMPKLLYHIAISFDKIKDTASANQFYAALKATYPDSEEAKAAPTRE